MSQVVIDAFLRFWNEASSPFSPIRGMFEANFVATLGCFFFSLVHQNSSIYDPYWSVAPVANALYLASFDKDGISGVWNDPRKALLVGLICLYGARLTISWWFRLGKDMLFGDAMVRHKHEDWRYVEIQQKPGLGAWGNWLVWWIFSSPVLIHLYPTMCTALGSVPMYYALAGSSGSRAPFGAIDIAAAAVLLTGIVLEMVADWQMDAFLRSDAARRKEVCRTGLWAVSRHPNYLGAFDMMEIYCLVSFWPSRKCTMTASGPSTLLHFSTTVPFRSPPPLLWPAGEQMIWLGVWLFAFAARGADAAASVVGFLNIVVLFATASIPWLERRQRERRPAYAQYQKEVACLIPFLL